MGRTAFEKVQRALSKHGTRCKNLRCRQTVALIGSALIQFSVGTVTSLGNHLTYLVSYMRVMGAKQEDLRYKDLSLLVFFGMLVSGFSSIPMGWITQKIGGWQAAAVGSAVYTFSFLIGYAAIQHDFTLYYLAAVCIACGVTLATIGALTEAIKWVPRWEGMVNGINYGAFAAAPALVNPFVSYIINPNNKSPMSAPYADKSEKYFTDKELLGNVPKAYAYGILGLIVIQIVGIAFLARYPCQPEDAEDQQTMDESASLVTESTLPTGQTRERTRKSKNEPFEELEVEEALTRPIFWKIYFLFALALAPVLTALATYKIYGQSFIQDDFFLARVGGSLGIAKGSGAFVWGILADFINLEGLVVAMTIGISISTVLVWMSKWYGKVLFTVAFVLLFLAGGGIFSLYPVFLVRYFGRNNFGFLYGIGLTTIAVAAAIMAIITIGYGTFYKGYTIFWLFLAFISTLSIWIAFYLYIRDYREVRITDIRTVTNDSTVIDSPQNTISEGPMSSQVGQQQ